MTVELNKDDLKSLVMGTSPYYNAFTNPLVKKCGSYTGGFVEKWSWNSQLDKLSEKQLWDLYKTCKNSWK